MQAWQSAQTGGSLSLPRPTSTSSGSQVRSWSQSSQGRRNEALVGRVPNAQGLQRLPERDSRSPRPHTSSYTHLSVGGGIPTNGSAKPPAAQPEHQDESPKMNNLRQSLLHHIQSVQQEIARLQLERQRTQQTSASELPDLPQAIAGAVRTSNGQTSAEFMLPSDDKVEADVRLGSGAMPPSLPLAQATMPSKKLFAPSRANALPPQAPDMPHASEEARVGVPPRSDSSQASRLSRPIPWQPSVPSARSMQLQRAIPVSTSTPASATIPMLGNGSVLLNSSIQAPLRGQSPTRLDGPARTLSPSRVAGTWQSPSKIMSTTAAKYGVGPIRNSLGPARGRVSRPIQQQDHFLSAVVRIQRFWRRQLSNRRLGNGFSNGQATKKRKFAPVHIAASRIQRKWRLRQWRRKFVDHSQNECGWVGSLEWLQHHNLLYGTELADAEDVKWWLQQRATAPLDREVDPWGSERLLEHLNRMWYGGRAAEIMQQQQQEQQEQLLQEQQQLLQQQQQTRERHRTREQRSEDIFTEFGIALQDHNSKAFAAVTQEATIGQSSSKPLAPSRRGQCAPGGVASSLRAFPTAERPTTRQISVGSKESCRAATSLSPRQDNWTTNIGTPSASPGADSLAARLRGAVLGGAPPPAMHGHQKGYRVASHSPPQTYRAARTTLPVSPNLGLPSMRPRSPVQSGSNTMSSSSRLSLPSSASIQSRSMAQVQRHTSSMNRALSGSPPPSIVGVGRSPMAGRSPTAGRR